MSSSSSGVRLLGTEKVNSLPELLDSFGLFSSFQDDLITHLHDVLRKQHSTVTVEEIEFLNEPLCNLGGMQIEGQEHLIKPQTLLVPLDLKVILGIPNGGKYELVLKLDLKCEGLDTGPSMSSDMYIKAQRALS